MVDHMARRTVTNMNNPKSRGRQLKKTSVMPMGGGFRDGSMQKAQKFV